MGTIVQRAHRDVSPRGSKGSRPPDPPPDMLSTFHETRPQKSPRGECPSPGDQERLATLVGGVAHEFNNLLVGILGNASLALESLADEAAERALLKRICAAAERATHLTGQMYAYAGKTDVAREVVDVGALLERPVRKLRRRLPRNVRLRTDLASGLPHVDVDPQQFRAVVRNLLANAVEAIGTNDGGICLRTGMITCNSGATPCRDDSAGTLVFLEVCDSGCGMDQQTQERMFEPFFSTKFTGRGLGLAEVQGIVRQHGGRVQVRSHPGSGTTIRVLLPAVDEFETTRTGDCQNQPSARAAHAGVGSVLVVDDDPDVLEVGCLCLERAGFRVQAASNGHDAVEFYRQHDIDVVLLDLVMPNEDGCQVLRRLRHLDPSARVILTSGMNAATVRRRTRGANPSAFLPKPYSAARLVEQVRALVADQADADADAVQAG